MAFNDYGILVQDGINYSHDTSESISYDNTQTELYSTDVQHALDELHAIIQHVSVDRNFDVLITDWEDNTDPETMTDYPYIYTVNTLYYTDESAPIWQCSAISGITSLSDKTEIQKIQDAYFYADRIELYAIEVPAIDLVLQVKGD